MKYLAGNWHYLVVILLTFSDIVMKKSCLISSITISEVILYLIYLIIYAFCNLLQYSYYTYFRLLYYKQVGQLPNRMLAENMKSYFIPDTQVKYFYFMKIMFVVSFIRTAQDSGYLTAIIVAVFSLTVVPFFFPGINPFNALHRKMGRYFMRQYSKECKKDGKFLERKMGALFLLGLIDDEVFAEDDVEFKKVYLGTIDASTILYKYI